MARLRFDSEAVPAATVNRPTVTMPHDSHRVKNKERGCAKRPSVTGTDPSGGRKMRLATSKAIVAAGARSRRELRFPECADSTMVGSSPARPIRARCFREWRKLFGLPERTTPDVLAMPGSGSSTQRRRAARRIVASPTGWFDGWSVGLLASGWAALLVLFSAYRLAFLVMYWPGFSGAGGAELALSLLEGVRFDLSVLFGLTGIPGLALLAVGHFGIRRWAGWAWLVLTVALILALGLLAGIDLYYYDFVGRRISFELWGMRGDTAPIAAMVVQGYLLPTLVIGTGLLIWAAAAAGLLVRAMRRPFRPVHPAARLAQWAGLLLLTVLAIRGGLQVKPLSENMAFRSSNMALGHLALNPTFTALKALDRREALLAFYPDSVAEAETRHLLGLPDPPLASGYPLLHAQPVSPRARPRNLVILTLESFSPQFMGAYGARPSRSEHFDRLAQEGLRFTDFYANGTRSLEGVPAILTGYPALPTSALIGSPLEQSRMASLSRILKDAGYSTLFLHGAYRGSMWFDQFAARSGFDRYIAKEDFPDPARQSDSTWGIFDHYALERLHAELEAARKPVFAFFFSLSLHTPYELPDERFRTFPPDAPRAALMNSFAYADWALGHFFELARASSYWRDTVFVITADHNLGGRELTRQQAMHIPLLILVPGDPGFPRGAVNATVGGQVDLAPTLLQLLGVPATQDFAGNSLLAPAPHRFVMFGLGGQAGWIDDQALVLHDLTRPLALYHYRSDPGLTRNLLPELSRDGEPEVVRQFQSYLQVTNNLLVRNRLVPPERQP